GPRLPPAAPLQLRARRPLAAAAVRAAARAGLRDHPAARGYAARRREGDRGLPGRGPQARRRALADRPLHALLGLQRDDRRRGPDEDGGPLQGGVDPDLRLRGTPRPVSCTPLCNSEEKWRARRKGLGTPLG